MQTHTVRIATRESRLALWQAHHVRERLLALPEVDDVELVPMTTRGDQLLSQPLATLGGKGLFIKELEQALLDGRADVAVHSAKDVPMQLDPSFALLGFMAREEPWDALVCSKANSIAALPQGARIGTASVRRQAQLLALRPDCVVEPVRGNLDTRLAKLDQGQFDALVLAQAGLLRLGLQHRIAAVLPPDQLLPAPGQGALALEVAASCPGGLREVLGQLVDPMTTLTVSAERSLSRALAGNCQVPLAAWATFSQTNDQPLFLQALAASPDGKHAWRASGHAAADLVAAEALGQRLAKELLAQGAGEVLFGGG